MEDVVRIAKGFRLIGIFGGPGVPSIIAVEGFQMILWSYVSRARAVEELLRVKQQPDTGQAIDVADNRYQLYGLACIGYRNFTSGEARRVDQTQQSLEYSYDRHLLYLKCLLSISDAGELQFHLSSIMKNLRVLHYE